VPVSIACYSAIALAFYQDISVNWNLAFLAWFLIGPVGIGVGFHRLFGHRQFKTYRLVEYVLAFLGTLSTYAPIYYWIAEHQYHHIHADTEKDINNPDHGFWHSFYYWRFKKDSEDAIHVKNRCMIIAGNDSMLRWFQNNFNFVIFAYMILTIMMGLPYFIALFVFPVLLERVRINMLNSVVHMKMPGSYQNFPDIKSYNTVWFGLLSFGFGWHNNHHARPRELVNSHRWYEIDIEGLIGKLLSKK
jgi:stearoyl-CoA desaturase (delta-9 desaturase)